MKTTEFLNIQEGLFDKFKSNPQGTNDKPTVKKPSAIKKGVDAVNTQPTPQPKLQPTPQPKARPKVQPTPQPATDLPDISRLNPQQRQALLQKVNARIAELSKGQQAQGNQPASKPHTGGRQRGGLSQTPNAIRQRQARAAKKAVAQPAQQGMTDLTQPTASASGGTITPTTTGYVHTANPNNPNQPKTANAPVNVNKISANKSSGLPTSDEQAKFQEKLKAAMAQQK